MKRKLFFRVMTILFFAIRIVATWVSLSGIYGAWAFCFFSVPFMLAFANEQAVLALVLLFCYCLLFVVSIVIFLVKKKSIVGLVGLQIILMIDILCSVISLFQMAIPFKLWGILTGIAGLIILAVQSANKISIPRKRSATVSREPSP